MPGLSRHLLIATTLLLTFLLNVEAWTNIGYSPVTLLQDTPFYVHPHILTNLCDVYDAPKLWNTEEFVGVTIISINKTSIDRNDLQAVIASNLAQDDVFNTGFLQGEWVPCSKEANANSLVYFSRFRSVRIRQNCVEERLGKHLRSWHQVARGVAIASGVRCTRRTLHPPQF